MRQLIRKFAYFGLPALLLCVLVVALSSPLALPIPRRLLFAKLGDLAFLVLTGVLFIKPLSALTNIKFIKVLMTYRREIGLASFWLFLFHFVGLFLSKAYLVSMAFDPKLNIFWGILAAVGMTLMGITANDFSIRKLRANWKKLHKIAYPTYYLVLIHYGLVEGEWGKVISFGGAYLVLKVLARRKLKSS